MRAVITQIGNSQGIRIPKPILDQLEFSQDQELELKVMHKKLIISSPHPRQDWEAIFANTDSHDPVIDDFQSLDSEIDEDEWTW